jgi:hypothetical protein
MTAATRRDLLVCEFMLAAVLAWDEMDSKRFFVFFTNFHGGGVNGVSD